jgi:hypothetical protein
VRPACGKSAVATRIGLVGHDAARRIKCNRCTQGVVRHRALTDVRIVGVRHTTILALGLITPRPLQRSRRGRVVWIDVEFSDVRLPQRVASAVLVRCHILGEIIHIVVDDPVVAHTIRSVTVGGIGRVRGRKGRGAIAQIPIRRGIGGALDAIGVQIVCAGGIVPAGVITTLTDVTVQTCPGGNTVANLIGIGAVGD